MTFNNEVKEVLNKMVKRSGINVTYYDGYIVMFYKVNIHALTQHRIVFSKNGYNLLVLFYNDYHENDYVFLCRRRKAYIDYDQKVCYKLFY